MQDDSIDGIYDTLKQTAKFRNQQVELDFQFIMYVQQVLTFVAELQTESFLCDVFNDTARYVDQGGGKRKGSFAIYIETCMLIDFLDLKRIQEKKKCVLEIYSLRCGLLICS
jgi:ribonucleoside-diphosphate reductase alpha chain